MREDVLLGRGRFVECDGGDVAGLGVGLPECGEGDLTSGEEWVRLLALACACRSGRSRGGEELDDLREVETSMEDDGEEGVFEGHGEGLEQGEGAMVEVQCVHLLVIQIEGDERKAIGGEGLAL